VKTRVPIPFADRLPAILAVALACSFAADVIARFDEHGVGWEAIGATRLGGAAATLGSSAGIGATRSWERLQALQALGAPLRTGFASGVASVGRVVTERGSPLELPALPVQKHQAPTRVRLACLEVRSWESAQARLAVWEARSWVRLASRQGGRHRPTTYCVGVHCGWAQARCAVW
jgi:hypothetical protein